MDSNIDAVSQRLEQLLSSSADAGVDFREATEEYYDAVSRPPTPTSSRRNKSWRKPVPKFIPSAPPTPPPSPLSHTISLASNQQTSTAEEQNQPDYTTPPLPKHWRKKIDRVTREAVVKVPVPLVHPRPTSSSGAHIQLNNEVPSFSSGQVGSRKSIRPISMVQTSSLSPSIQVVYKSWLEQSPPPPPPPPLNTIEHHLREAKDVPVSHVQTAYVHAKEETVEPPPVVRPKSPTPPPPAQTRPPVAIPKRVPPQIFRPPTPPLATHYVKKRSADPIGVEMTSYMKPRELHTIYPDTSHSEKQLPRPSVVSSIIQHHESDAGPNSLTSKPSRALHADTISSETHNVSFNPCPPVPRKRPPPERALPRPPSTSSSSPSSTRSSRSWSKYLHGSEAPLHENLHAQALTNATSNRDRHPHPHPRGTHSHGHHSERRLTRVGQAPPMRRSKTEKSGLGIVRTVSYPQSGFWQHIEIMAKSMLEKFRRWTQPSM